MSQTFRFPKTELLRYRQVARPQFGASYVLTMGTLQNRTGLRYKDYALRAKLSRDGLEAILFDEEPLRTLRTDRDLYWTVNDEGADRISLYSQAEKKYLVLDRLGARLSRKKQLLTLSCHGTVYRIGTIGKDGVTRYLRGVPRDDTPFGYVFTSATAENCTGFAFLERVFGLPLKPTGEKRLTVGSVSDIHVDYGIQTRAPYLRRTVMQAARAYRRRYDLDAMITCGDNISDNASHPTIFACGAAQDKFPRELFLKTQDRLQAALQKAFRRPEQAGNIFWLSGNHDCQVGDRQPEGKRFNSNDYTRLLPGDLLHPLFKPAPMDVGVQEELLCYEYRVKGVPFLVLNTPLYPLPPLDPKDRQAHRPAPGHTVEQALWLSDRLKEIDEELGDKAVVFVQSHYPFHRGSFISFTPHCKGNLDAYLLLDRELNRHPNLFWCYGHVHGTDDWITHRRTSECTQTHCPMDMGLDAGGELRSFDSPDRGNLRSDVTLATGFKSIFMGSLAYFETSYFRNDGKRFRSWLTDIDVPFSQGMTIEVYGDRVVLTMENFGTKQGTALIKNGTCKVKPMVYPIET